MLPLLESFLAEQWRAGTGAGPVLIDPVLGTGLARLASGGFDLDAGLRHARQRGGAALRELTYKGRAALLRAGLAVLRRHADDYHAIATANRGAVAADAVADIAGAFDLIEYYAKLGDMLGERRFLVDGDLVPLGRDPLFSALHLLTPTPGVAVCFPPVEAPGLGMWERIGPALLSGVPVLVVAATSTAWLSYRMLRDLVDAASFPPGSISLLCGAPDGLLDALKEFDVVTGAGTVAMAAALRAHPVVTGRALRTGFETHGDNAMLLLPGESPGGALCAAFSATVVRELARHAGLGSATPRTILVPAENCQALAADLVARCAALRAGNPRNPAVGISAQPDRAGFAAARASLAHARTRGVVLHDGAGVALLDADPAVACCLGPSLLGPDDGGAGLEPIAGTGLFGPMARLLPYASLAAARGMLAPGEGAAALSLFGSDLDALAATALELAPGFGRVHVVSPDTLDIETGHGRALPQALQGGPGRAGGGEKLGGLRALYFYHRRVAVQASTEVLSVVRPRGRWRNLCCV